MKEVLDSVIATLDTVPIVGIENMRRVIGCVDALSMITGAISGQEEQQNGGQENQ